MHQRSVWFDLSSLFFILFICFGARREARFIHLRRGLTEKFFDVLSFGGWVRFSLVLLYDTPYCERSGTRLVWKSEGVHRDRFRLGLSSTVFNGNRGY